MRFKKGQRVLVKKEVAVYSDDVKKLLEEGLPLSGSVYGDLPEESVICAICNKKHKPVVLVVLDRVPDNEIWLTPCEINPILDKKINKILKL